MEIRLLRLGHRLPRDERISTHVVLVARAFGASSAVYCGQHDSGLEESIERICARWGARTPHGDFSLSYEQEPLRHIRKAKKDGYAIVHLTMYGVPVEQVSDRIKGHGKALVVVGSEAVPSEIFHLADLNVSVTNQPHSEVAALAILLDRIHQGKELGDRDFSGALRIIPDPRGKRFAPAR